MSGSEIRYAYRYEYLEREREQDTTGGSLIKAFFTGGAVSAVLGLTAFAFTAPVSLPIAAGIAAVAFIAGGFAVSDKVARAAEKRAEDALNRDIENFSLVNRFIKNQLPHEQENLDAEAEKNGRAQDKWRQQHEKKQQELDGKRKAAVRLVSKGLEVLASQANANLQQVELYRKEAAAIGAEFGAAAQKPEPAVAAAPVETGYGRSTTYVHQAGR